ncbi:hypothetical protein [Streptomyces sp. NPDC091217]|uniref:hypothetical protein n=1 Tax=Streptomyces sp. NPDC091217 TaxID=3365975 RepID=UPI00380837B3
MTLPLSLTVRRVLSHVLAGTGTGMKDVSETYVIACPARTTGCADRSPRSIRPRNAARALGPRLRHPARS